MYFCDLLQDFGGLFHDSLIITYEVQALSLPKCRLG
jgi:hypothetical protein